MSTSTSAPSRIWRTSPLADLNPTEIYRLMTSVIVPRPIAFVSTRSREGIANLAPFSYFNAVASSPPVLMISVTPRSDGREKDTLKNIRDTGEFVVNSASASLAEAINQCSAEYAPGVDEFAMTGLTPLDSSLVSAPRVAECAVQLECRLHQLLPIGSGGPGSTVVVFGEIVTAHVAEDLFDPQNPKALLTSRLDPLSRLGGTEYGKTSGIFSLKRPKLTD